MVSLALLSLNHHAEASRVSDEPIGTNNGILTRSWKYFENMVQSAFEDEEKEEAERRIPAPGKVFNGIRSLYAIY